MVTPLTDLNHLRGKTVLVRSTRDQRNPPAARRGTLEVQTAANGKPVVRVILDFPDMFLSSSHDHNLTLDEESLRRLIASERDGTYELVTEESLD